MLKSGDQRLCPPPLPTPCLENREPLTQGPYCAPADGGLQEALRRCGIVLDHTPHRLSLRRVDPILQSGPTCGPVALAMMLGSKLSPQTLVDMAQKAGFSINGELFGCNFMERLVRDAAKHLGLSLEITVEDNLYDKDLVSNIHKGAYLLVPYDSDFNFAPCKKRGHKAHWALIVGVLELRGLPSDLTGSGKKVNMAEDHIYVLARHGKSRHLAAWNLAELSSSNRNLYEFPPQREQDNLLYVVPDGGVAGENGLCSRFLLVKGL